MVQPIQNLNPIVRTMNRSDEVFGSDSCPKSLQSDDRRPKHQPECEGELERGVAFAAKLFSAGIIGAAFAAEAISRRAIRPAIRALHSPPIPQKRPE
jgi:hypothetical protein